MCAVLRTRSPKDRTRSGRGFDPRGRIQGLSPWLATALLLISVTFVTVAFAVPAVAQWTTQSPNPTFLDVRGVGAPSPEHVFIATSDDSFDDGGALWESTDGGGSWLQRDVPLNLHDPLNGLFFLDAQNGWAYGNRNYRTTDGGATWIELPILGSTYFMEFFTPTFGLATSNTERNVSRDAGDSWTPSPNGIFAMDFADAQTGLGASESGLYRTVDGGDTFAPVLGGDADAVTFLSAASAVAIVAGDLVHSTDGGATWSTAASALGRTRVHAVSSEIALAWGRTGPFGNYDDRVLRTDDGGETWTDLGEVIGDGIWALTTLDAQTVIAAGLSGSMHRSVDGGQAWVTTFTSPGPAPGFLSSAKPAFADASTGYFGYGSGFVIRTDDAGASWRQISSGAGQSLNDIDRFPNGDLIAVGEAGTVLSSNGTSPWIVHERFTTQSVEAVQVLGAQDVVAVDETGRVFRSSDSGASWTGGGSTPSGLSAADLHFTTLLDGWVIGSGFGAGALFHTTDGGDTWTPVTTFAGGYKAVDFEGINGWAANVGGRYYRSTDSGDTWIQEELPFSPFQIADMDFFDESIGYAVGWGNYAVRTVDGGITWQAMPVPAGNVQFTDIYLIGPNELWLSTGDDVAYYSATGGENWAVLEIGSAGFGSFTAIAASPEGAAWAVGFQGYLEYFPGPPPPPLNRPPEASFDFVTTGLTVELTEDSSDPDGFIVSWEWDFDDGNMSTEQNPTHTYADEGTYIIRLTVTDDDGATGSAGRLVVVQPAPGGVFGDFTEVTPLDPLFVTPQDEDFWVATTAPADFDGDDDLDIAVLGFYVVYNESVEERLVLLRNDGQAGPGEWEFTYLDVPLNGLSTGASDMAWGDVDNDGDEDLAVGTDGRTVIYRNDGGTLVMTDTVLPDYWEDNFQADFDLNSISWADYDNDSDLDLLLPSVYADSTFSYHTVLMRNDGPNGTGGWNFTDSGAGLASTGHAQSSWADFDDDADLDLLLVELAPLTDNGFIRRYRNDGNGVFVGEDILGGLTMEHGEVHWGDYDEDGDYDILVAGHIQEADGSFDRVLRIYRNDDETYVQIDVIPSIAAEGWFDLTAATWADYDSDGDVDILLTGTYNSGSQIEGRARIYANDGTGNFADSGNDLPAPRASGSRGGTFSWLDLDNDFDLDYFIAGEYFVPGGNGLIEAQMHAYRNDTGGSNLAPSAPTGLVSNVVAGGAGARVGSGATVYLSWTAARDDQTPSAALTYDLDLYLDGVPVEAARRLPEPGNISAVTEWVLTDLADGSYRWLLRAVDSSFNGGTVAEGAFTVGATTDVPGDLLPGSFQVSNYPNPFHTSTSFRFALPRQSDVTLTVYDVHGRRVATLVEGTRPAGYHEVSWGAAGLASGTYFARFSAGQETKTRRLMLVK